MIQENAILHREDLIEPTPNITKGILNLLICPICCDILDNPVMEVVNQHNFCQKCVQVNGQYIDICPVCREPTKFYKALLVSNLLELYSYKCPYNIYGCEFLGSFSQLEKHLKICEQHIKILQEQLQIQINEMKFILNQNIDQHLKEQHFDFYLKDLKEWQFLNKQDRQWGWWIKQLNNDTSCEVCIKNYLADGYKLELIDRQRRKLIRDIDQEKSEIKIKINECVEQMKIKLDEINPHLKEAHFEIYINHVKDWEFLYSDDDEWAEWWYSQKPWWNGQKCQTCQQFFDQKKDNIFRIDAIRRQNLLLLAEIKNQ